MKNFKLVSAILSGQWLIEPNWANAHLPVIEGIIKGEDVNQEAHEANKKFSSGNPRQEVAVITGGPGTYEASYYTGFKNAPENSIALINLVGPVLKYGDGCGGIGSADLAELVKEANNSSNISAIIVRIDSPGGMVDGTASLADAIKASKKPVIGFVDDGMMASAATWVGSACDEIFASQKTDTIGSIGVYTTMVDRSGQYEKMGIKLIEVYAPQSTDKNKSYKDALNGDTTLIKDELKFIAHQFIKVIKSNRKGKINMEFDDPFTGKMYNAEDAIKVGLIDAIGTFDQAVQRAAELSQSGKQSNNSDTNMKAFIKSTQLYVAAFFGAIFSAGEEKKELNITEAQMEELDAQLGSIEALRTERDAAIAARTSVEADLSTARTSVETLTANLARMTTERNSWEAKAIEFGAKSGGDEKKPVQEESDKIDAKVTDYIIDMSAEHNQNAEKMLG